MIEAEKQEDKEVFDIDQLTIDTMIIATTTTTNKVRSRYGKRKFRVPEVRG